MKTIDEYFAELERDPEYAYSKAVGDAGVDLLAATYGIDAVVAHLKDAEDAHTVHIAYYNDVVLPEIERGSTNSTRIFSSTSDGVAEERGGGSLQELQTMVVVDNLFVGRLSSMLRAAVGEPEEVLRIAEKLDDITEEVEAVLINYFGESLYNELYGEASARLG